MSTQSKSFHCSLLLHFLIAATLFYSQQLLDDDMPPLVIDFSLALSEAIAGEPNQPPGQPVAATTPAPQEHVVTPSPEQVQQPAPKQKPVQVAKQKIEKPQKKKPKIIRKKIEPMVETRKEPAPLVTTETSTAESATAAANRTAPAGTPTRSELVGGAKASQHAAQGTRGAQGSNRGIGAGMRYDFNFVRQRILNNLRFPTTARKMGLSGKIVVSFILKKDGQVEHITVIASSGHALLDNAVIATIRRVAPFPKPPVSAQLMLPIVFHLKS